MSTADHPPVDGGSSSAPSAEPVAPASVNEHAETPAEAVSDGAASPKPKRRRGMLVTIILLSVALIATGGVLTFALLQLDSALVQIDDQQEQLDEQSDLIDQKETFSQAATELMATAAQLDGVPFATIMNTNTLQRLIGDGWTHRWNSSALERASARVDEETVRLATLIAEAAEQKASNGTGTYFERATDRLGQGFVATSLKNTDETCEEDVWGCVTSDDPFTIHYDHAETRAEPYMNDFLRAGLAYHEYAHVLQFTNPGPTDKALEAFDDDWETMADCYALTYLDGWKLDHTIWVSSIEYWEVSVGYGYTCNKSQKAVIREWVDSLGYVHEPISQ